MIAEDLIIAVCNDVSGQTRGKSFPIKEREERFKKGVGWVPTNVQITCFNSIAESPYGSTGDLALKPDKDAEVVVDFEDGAPAEHFVLGDIRHLDGQPWECCTRSLAKAAVARLKTETGLEIKMAFEQEFLYSGVSQEGWQGFGLESYRKGSPFARTFVAALQKAGLRPDSFLPEYGAGQYEGTLMPSVGVRAADECVIFREIARATAHRLGHRVCFAPLISPTSVGNGVHIHFSFLDEAQQPVGYEANAENLMASPIDSFCAGVLRYMPAITALMAASVPSYLRLTPHRWSAAFNNLAIRDREAGLRVCPINAASGQKPEAQFNIEYRAADATASPYLQLAVLVQAGLQGIRERLVAPVPTTGDLSVMSEDQLEALGVLRLPTTLAQAIDEMVAEPLIQTWFPGRFTDIYARHKQQEISEMQGLSDEEICRRYAQCY